MNSAVFYSSKTDMWATPQDFFDALDAEFHFTLDACAVKENAKCEAYYTPEQDGLDQPWTGRVWCNPPYGRNVGQWVKKAHDLETFRRYIAEIPLKLQENYIFKIGVVYGNVLPNEKSIKFYFERVKNNDTADRRK